jgi:Tol biopolymer transport system component
MKYFVLTFIFISYNTLAQIHYPQEKHFRNVRQLTFGGNNAEAYFSPNGKK